jgi:hypothetical protein
MHTKGGSEELDHGVLVVETLVELLPDFIDSHGGLRCLSAP